MELNGSSYFYALAAVSTTFVGFSSLIMTFRQTSGGGLSRLDSLVTQVFIQPGFAVAAMEDVSLEEQRGEIWELLGRLADVRRKMEFQASGAITAPLLFNVKRQMKLLRRGFEEKVRSAGRRLSRFGRPRTLTCPEPKRLPEISSPDGPESVAAFARNPRPNSSESARNRAPVE